MAQKPNDDYRRLLEESGVTSLFALGAPPDARRVRERGGSSSRTVGGQRRPPTTPVGGSSTPPQQIGGQPIGSFGDIIARGISANRLQQPQNPLDPETQAELDFIRREGELSLAEHAQRVAVANAEADFERRQLQRLMGIAEDTGELATGMANEDYAALQQNLQGIIPQTQAAYDTGVQNVGAAYSSGQQNLQAPQADAQALAQQLAAISGSPTATQEAAQYTAPSNEMAALLSGAQGAATGNLSTLGAGDVGAAQAALPGYETERQELVSDIGLDMGAQLAQLRNELSGVHPDFIPFNYGALQLQQERSIADAIRQGLSRREAEQAEEENFAGLSGARHRAEQLGRPDLFTELLRYTNQAEAGVPLTVGGQTVPGEFLDPAQALNQLIGSYSNPTDTPLSNTGFLQGRRNDRSRDILSELLAIFQGNY